jgi:hypothetical protein
MKLGFQVWGSGFKVNVAAKRRKKHKNQFSGLVNSRCYDFRNMKCPIILQIWDKSIFTTT